MDDCDTSPVVFRRLLTRETNAATWRELAPIDAAIGADGARALKARRVPALNMA